MFFDDFSVDEVFSNYARIMEEEGNLKKKASYVVPKSFLGDDNYTEVEVHEELQRIAAAGDEGGKLYGVVSEDVAANAHPEGSTKIVDASEGLGEVETLEDQQKRMLDVAEKKTKLASLVIDFVNDLDTQGFIAMAKELDGLTAEFLGVKEAACGEMHTDDDEEDDLSPFGEPLDDGDYADTPSFAEIPLDPRQQHQEHMEKLKEQQKQLQPKGKDPSKPTPLPAMNADDNLVPDITDPAKMKQQQEQLQQALKGVKPRVAPQGLAPRGKPGEVAPAPAPVQPTGPVPAGADKPVPSPGAAPGGLGKKPEREVPILGKDPRVLPPKKPVGPRI